MGDPRTLKRKYETPKVVWSRERIDDERKLIEEYGLVNMREVWIFQLEVKKIRRQARSLLALGETGAEQAKKLIARCVRLGYAKPEATLESLLGISVRDVLERRLETRVMKRGLAKSARQSRQLISHGLISVAGRKVDAPGFIVPIADEQTITYFKPIDISAPAMAQRSAAARSAEAKTPEAAAQAPEAEAPAKEEAAPAAS